MTDNPLLAGWDCPLGAPPFDRITPAHFPEALAEGMRRQSAEVAAISSDPREPDFRNVMEALEDSGRLMGRTALLLSHLVGCIGGAAWDALQEEWSPRLAEHATGIKLDPRLFARVRALDARRGELGLAADQARLLDRTLRDMIRSGAALDADGRARMTAIEGRLAELEARFSRNVVADEGGWHLTLSEADLDGLPAFARDELAEAARAIGLPEGAWSLPLSRSAVESFLSHSRRRDLRRAAWEAWCARGANPGERHNAALASEILALRAEKAHLLGFQSFAEYALDDTMAGSVVAAEGLLKRIWDPARAKALEERERLARLAEADGVGTLEAWDWRHYAERERAALHGVDEGEAKPYLTLDAMMGAAFEVAGRLFGVSFLERPDLPTWHPDVRAFEVREASGTLGLLYMDNFARPGKRSGAWMEALRDHESFLGRVTPVVVNCNNIPKAATVLLGMDEALTLLHELGHGLHALLSKARYPSQAGVHVSNDFVEFHSQVLEHWLTAEGVLARWARHSVTGEPMPESLLRAILGARRHGQGFATVELCGASLLDLALHAADPANLDVEAFESQHALVIGMPREIGYRHRIPHFTHLFSDGGAYAAGYYGYLWAAVLDADGFVAFEEAGNPFDPDMAARLRRVYEGGDAEDGMELYVAFRGRPPKEDAMLRMRGLLP